MQLIALLLATLTMEYIEAETVHIAHQGGAINSRESKRVDVELGEKESAVVVFDSGTRSEHNLYENYSTDEETVWHNVWRGTYTQTADALHLDLTLKQGHCDHTKEQSGKAKEVLACPPLEPRRQLRCSADEVKDDEERVLQVWRCEGWILGKTGCLHVTGNRHGAESFATCSPSPRPNP